VWWYCHGHAKNGGNKRYPMRDAALGAFRVFFMQYPSFLAYQRHMQQTKGHHNAEGLFGVKRIPTDSPIRSAPTAGRFQSRLTKAAWHAGIVAGLRSGAALCRLEGSVPDLGKALAPTGSTRHASHLFRRPTRPDALLLLRKPGAPPNVHARGPGARARVTRPCHIWNCCRG